MNSSRRQHKVLDKMAKAKKEAVEYTNTPESREKLVYCVKEVSGLLAQQASIREAIKDIKKSVKENLGITPQKFNKMVRIYHDDAREKVEDDLTEVLDLYDAVLGKEDD